MEISPVSIQAKAYNSSPSFRGLNGRVIYDNYIYDRMFGNPEKSKISEILKDNFAFIGRDKNYFSIQKAGEEIVDQIGKEPYDEVLNFGFSNAGETYDLRMSMIEAAGRKGIPLEKLPKIYAFDTNDILVDTAKKGWINLEPYEINYLRQMYGERADKYIGRPYPLLILPGDDVLVANKRAYQMCPEVRSGIVFSKGDVINELNALEPNKKRYVLSRNLAIYLPLQRQKLMADLLDKKLAVNSRTTFGVREFDLCAPDDAEILSKIDFDPEMVPRKSRFYNAVTMPNSCVARIEKLGTFEYDPNLGCTYKKVR